MTATDELRKMLDERGVKYRDYFNANKTWWSGRENVGWCAEGRPSANGLYVMIEAVLTPAQAIAATLGRRTCHIQQTGHVKVAGVDYYDDDYECSECGAEMFEGYNFCPNCGREVIDE